ncbi:MAG TPA: DUF4623 domain-containing protein [Candidatus Sumerlaeia bacterium]|nr:MAG: hypothetical protein BWY12_00477 [candidate division BRC1 bacterium ADurb.Bin183]HRR99885.1 DUF4623 domain-containing protein [Candidatus Sumerlaeia bacterium]
MKISKILIVTLLMTLCIALAANAQVTPTKTITMYWNKLCGYNPASDDVRRMSVSLDGQTIITLNKGINKAQIWHGRSGVIWNKMAESGPKGPDSLNMTGVSGGTFAISDGGFTQDGAFIVCNLFTATTHNLKVYIWDTVTTAPRVIYDAIPAPSPRNGDGLAVMGRLSDNTAKVIVVGNNAASRPVVLTTADKGRTWTATILANPVHAQTVQFDSTGAFWCTRYAAGTPLQKYNPDGSIAGAAPPNRIPHPYAFGGLYLDEANGLIYGAGIRENNPVRVFDVATGALIASSTEPILLGGFTTSGGVANGSACVKGLPDGTILVGSERNGIARMRLVNVITADGAGNTPTTTNTIQAAITAYNVGGPLAAYKPLMIAVDPTVTFDESIDLNNGAAWNGKIAGDLLIKSAVPGTNAVIKLRKGPSSNDAIWIAQETNNIMFKDLVLCPSLQAPLFTGNVAMIRMDQNTAESVINWVELYNVVQTDIAVGGEPMVKTKAEAIAMTAAGPPPPTGSTVGTASQHISLYTDAGESMSLLLDNCVSYASKGMGWRFYPHGVSGESLIVNNGFVAWTTHGQPCTFGNSALRILCGTAAVQKYVTVTGDDAGAGPSKCTAFIEPAYHALYNSTSAAKFITKINNLLVWSSRTGDAANIPRSVSSSSGVCMPMISDCIFKNQNNVNVVVQTVGATPGSAPYVWERNTFFTNGNALLGTAKGAQWPEYQTITLRDCIFAGPGTKLGIAGTHAGAYAENCAWVTEGPSAIGARGVIDSDTNSINWDPIFKDNSPTSFTKSSFMDVQNYGYKGKAAGGANLAGGADWIGGFNPAIQLRDADDAADVAAIDFGTCDTNTTTTKTFKIKNLGPGSPLAVAGSVIVTGAPYTIDSGDGAANLGVNGTATIVVAFRPTVDGTYNDTLRITSDSGGAPAAQLNIPITGIAYTTSVTDWKLIK